MVNIKDIARQVGMSPSTISRVVNGRKHVVSSEKRKQILKLVEETGYVPNRAARSMVLKRSFTVGIIIPDAFNMFQGQLFSIIKRHLISFGYHVLFFFVKFDDQSEKICLNCLKAEQPDGVIMIHKIKNPFFYEYVRKTGLPTVTSTFHYPGINAIHVNEKQASKDAVNYLIGLGYHRILLISGDGFTDELAIGAIRVLIDEGLWVPEDVSVIGFDDIDIAQYTAPSLTTIYQPLTEIGEKTALALHRQISGDNITEEEQILPYKLVIRESTRASKNDRTRIPGNF